MGKIVDKCEVCGQPVVDPEFKWFVATEKAFLQSDATEGDVIGHLELKRFTPHEIEERLELLRRQQDWEWNKRLFCQLHYNMFMNMPNLEKDKGIDTVCEICGDEAHKYDPYNGYPYCMYHYKMRVDDNILYYKPYDARDNPKKQEYYWGDMKWPG